MIRGFVSKWMASFRHLMMNKKNLSCDDARVAAVMRLVHSAPRSVIIGLIPRFFVNALTSDSAKIGLALETTMVLRPMNLFGTILHADRFDP